MGARRWASENRGVGAAVARGGEERPLARGQLHRHPGVRATSLLPPRVHSCPTERSITGKGSSENCVKAKFAVVLFHALG